VEARLDRQVLTSRPWRAALPSRRRDTGASAATSRGTRCARSSGARGARETTTCHPRASVSQRRARCSRRARAALDQPGQLRGRRDVADQHSARRSASDTCGSTSTARACRARPIATTSGRCRRCQRCEASSVRARAVEGLDVTYGDLGVLGPVLVGDHAAGRPNGAQQRTGEPARAGTASSTVAPG